MFITVIFLAFVSLNGAEQASYYLDFLTHNIRDAGCDDCKIYAKVYSRQNKLGKIHSADLGRLYKPQHNEFRTDEWDYFRIRAEDVGFIECIELTSKSSNAIHVSEVVISSTSHPQPTHMYNSAGKWLSTSSKSNHVSKLKLCAHGVEVYFITTKVTTAKKDSGSDSIHLTAVIEGAEETTQTGYFEHARLDDFRKGAEDTFVFRDLQSVHGVKCITLRAQGSDKLTLEWIKVESSTQSTVTFYNKHLTSLSKDKGEGTSPLKFCK
jgi:hypothetical protein